MEMQRKSIHIVAIPFPVKGHSTPVINLCKTLASEGVKVTFVTTHDCLPMIEHDLSNHPLHNIHALQLSSVDGSPKGYAVAVDTLMQKPVREFIYSTIHKSDSPISCILADTFLPWASDIAAEFQLPLVSFWTEAVAVFNIYFNAHLLISNGHLGAKPAGERVEKDEDWIDYIPGVQRFLPRDLPSHLQGVTDMSDFEVDHVIRSFENVRKADVIVMNSFCKLEAQAVDAAAISANLKVPVMCVGPLLASPALNPGDHDRDYLEWLDAKPPRSVLYICMGSWLKLSKAQTEEIANALLLSQQPFLWVLREDMDMMKEQKQGLIVPWCAQLHVLSHPSVGGFLSHCGWNSTLESIWSGVPMLGFSLFGDQHTNCKLIVDEWKIGLRLRSGQLGDKLIDRGHILTAVNKLMKEEEGEEMRKRAERLRDMAKEAIMEDGLSKKNIDVFFEHLKLGMEKRNEKKTGGAS